MVSDHGANVAPRKRLLGSSPGSSGKNFGGVTEWFKVTGLNPVEWLITLRGFESYRLLYASLM